MQLRREMQEEIVGEAARAPSVHNVQPARFRFVDSGEVRLYRALDRSLPAADPSGRDVRLSLGAAFEGLALALSTRALRLGAPAFDAAKNETAPDGHEHVASASIDAGAVADPLARWVAERRAYRGRFPPASESALERLRQAMAGTPDVRLVTGRDTLAALARRYDRASYGFLGQPAYFSEFSAWCRFRRSHPRWSRDGLNAECLGLSGLESAAASVCLRPSSFALLKRIGLGRALTSEAAEIKSASALLLFCPACDLDPFVAGRRFYRAWLELTALSMCLCPLSALADDEGEARALEREHAIPGTQRLWNAFRVGPIPAKGIPQSARLPIDELLV